MKPAFFNVILIGPKYPMNVGAVARAMANLGGKQLYIVDKKCELGHEAKQGAAGAQSPLENAMEYSNFQELKENEPNGIYIGLTRRLGHFRHTGEISQVFGMIQESDFPDSPIYFVFGPEDHGLGKEDLLKVNYTANLPTYGDFETYNLAQATLLTLFMAQEKWNKKAENFTPVEAAPFPEEMFKKWLEETGYDLNRNKNAASKLTLMIQRSAPTPKEVELLKAALFQNIRKLGELKQDR